jgi:hypothetical protein
MLLLLKSVSNSLNETMLHLNEVINIRNNIGLSEPLNLKKLFRDNPKCSFWTNNCQTSNNYNRRSKRCNGELQPCLFRGILHNIISNSIRYSHPDREPLIGIKWLVKTKWTCSKFRTTELVILKNADKIFGMYKTFSNNPSQKELDYFITKPNRCYERKYYSRK